MGTRRMFSSRITESTRFIKMPATSQNLYFHLGMKADDDGIVEAYPIMCAVGSTEDDLRVLVGKEFVTVLNSDLVSYLNDWKEHNTIRADRKVDSIYKDLLLKVCPDVDLLQAKETYYSRTKSICQTNGRQVSDNLQTNDGISKDKISKGNLSKEKKAICSEPEKSAPSQPPIIELPLNDKTLYGVQQADYEKWCELYPAVDVMQELRKMCGWLDSNPTKRKTRKGIAKFVNGWLSREQDKGKGSNSIIPDPKSEESVPAQPAKRYNLPPLTDEERNNNIFGYVFKE